MSSSVVSFQDQKSQDGLQSLQSLGFQIGMNVGIAAFIMLVLVRPDTAPKYVPNQNYDASNRRSSIGGFKDRYSWVRMLFKHQPLNQRLVDKIGEDAVVFLRFIRMLRWIMIYLATAGVLLIIYNIFVTKASGDWPPTGLSVFSMAGINYHNGQWSSNGDFNYYILPFFATILFSLVVIYFLFRENNEYINMRQNYFRRKAEEEEMKKTFINERSVLIRNIPDEFCTDEGFQMYIRDKLYEALCDLVEDEDERTGVDIVSAMVGRTNSTMRQKFELHEEMVRKLEDALTTYLEDPEHNRPTLKKSRNCFNCFGLFDSGDYQGSEEVDAIDYYTDRVRACKSEIEQSRQDREISLANFGWVSLNSINSAFKAAKLLKHIGVDARPSPPPYDLMWSNLGTADVQRKAQRTTVWIIFTVVIFLWSIPVSILSSLANVTNIVRYIPNSQSYIQNNSSSLAFVQSFITPLIMTIFMAVLPYFFRFLVNRQGYLTKSTTDRQLLVMLFIFFIVNNLLVFSLEAVIVGFYGQIRSLILSGSLPKDTQAGEYVLQIAQNISDVSTYWISYTCITAVTLTFQMKMPWSKLLPGKRLSPNQLRAQSQAAPFSFPSNYSIILFTFGVSLIYSVIAPLILVFAFIFFFVCTFVYKYQFMYMVSTEKETGGRMWPVLVHIVFSSIALFQVIMMIYLGLKGGGILSGVLIVPFLATCAAQYRFHKVNIQNEFKFKERQRTSVVPSNLGPQCIDPVLNAPLSKVNVYADLKKELQTVRQSRHRNSEGDIEMHSEFRDEGLSEIVSFIDQKDITHQPIDDDEYDEDEWKDELTRMEGADDASEIPSSHPSVVQSWGMRSDNYDSRVSMPNHLNYQVPRVASQMPYNNEPRAESRVHWEDDESFHRHFSRTTITTDPRGRSTIMTMPSEDRLYEPKYEFPEDNQSVSREPEVSMMPSEAPTSTFYNSGNWDSQRDDSRMMPNNNNSILQELEDWKSYNSYCESMPAENSTQTSSIVMRSKSPLPPLRTIISRIRDHPSVNDHPFHQHDSRGSPRLGQPSLTTLSVGKSMRGDSTNESLAPVSISTMPDPRGPSPLRQDVSREPDNLSAPRRQDIPPPPESAMRMPVPRSAIPAPPPPPPVPPPPHPGRQLPQRAPSPPRAQVPNPPRAPSPPAVQMPMPTRTPPQAAPIDHEALARKRQTSDRHTAQKLFDILQTRLSSRRPVSASEDELSVFDDNVSQRDRAMSMISVFSDASAAPEAKPKSPLVAPPRPNIPKTERKEMRQPTPPPMSQPPALQRQPSKGHRPLSEEEHDQFVSRESNNSGGLRTHSEAFSISDYIGDERASGTVPPLPNNKTVRPESMQANPWGDDRSSSLTEVWSNDKDKEAVDPLSAGHDIWSHSNRDSTTSGNLEALHNMNDENGELARRIFQQIRRSQAALSQNHQSDRDSTDMSLGVFSDSDDEVSEVGQPSRKRSSKLSEMS